MSSSSVPPAKATPASEAGDAVRQLLHRVLGPGAARVHVELEPGGPERFTVSSTTSELTIRGTTPVAIASGLRWFLAEHCDRQSTWDDPHVQLPRLLPRIAPTTCATPYRRRYYLNHVTYAYSLTYWTWERWEREIDWMALHGVNTTVALVGFEAVWLNVYRRFGFSDDEILASLAPPLYLCFQWHGCFDTLGRHHPGLAHHPTHRWIERRVSLQRRILERLRALGIEPVTQAFSGHVPRFAAEAWGDRAAFGSSAWAEFPPAAHLDPRHPLFRTLGAAFVEEHAELFGPMRLYLSNPFQEVIPPDGSPAYLRAVGEAVYASMAAADPEAVWVFEAWPFSFHPDFWTQERVAALLGAAPEGRMLVLDNWSERESLYERTGGFGDRPWVWCMLENFGARPGLHGSLDRVRGGPAAHLAGPNADRLVGIGMTPEAIELNPAVYEYVADLAWCPNGPDLDAWFARYAQRRYGAVGAEAVDAWRLLGRTVFRSAVVAPPRSILCARPTLTPEDDPYWPVERGYEPRDIAHAWRLLIEAGRRRPDVAPLQLDIAEIGAQVVADRGEELYAAICAAAAERDAERVRALGDALLELMDDLELLAGTRPDALLGRWLETVRSWGDDAADAIRHEHDARRLISVWGTATGDLVDYACRHWAGLIGTLYRPRWRLFLDRLTAALASGEPFDSDAVAAELRAFEEAWIGRTDSPLPLEPTGEALAVSLRLVDRYAPG